MKISLIKENKFKKNLLINKRGLTLIELLIVVSIIGLLSGVMVINVSKWRARTRDSQRVADVRTIQNALAMYQDDFGGFYPSCDITVINGSSDCLSVALNAVGVITVMPTDPVNSGNYVYSYCSTAACTGEAYDDISYYIEYWLETTGISGKNQGQNFTVP